MCRHCSVVNKSPRRIYEVCDGIHKGTLDGRHKKSCLVAHFHADFFHVLLPGEHDGQARYS